MPCRSLFICYLFISKNKFYVLKHICQFWYIFLGDSINILCNFVFTYRLQKPDMGNVGGYENIIESVY